MISVTKLLFARNYFGDSLRYTKTAHKMTSGAAEGVGPVVVWNSTPPLLYGFRFAQVQ